MRRSKVPALGTCLLAAACSQEATEQPKATTQQELIAGAPMTADARLVEGGDGKWRLVCMGRFRSLGQGDTATYDAFVTFFQEGTQTALLPGQVSPADPTYNAGSLSDQLTLTHPSAVATGALTVRMVRTGVDPRRRHSCQVVVKQNSVEVMRAESRPPRPVLKPPGTFVADAQGVGNHNTNDVALGDLDGDGDLDVYEGNGGLMPDRVWLNDGSGRFTDTGQQLGSNYTRAVVLGDLDGDGDLDAMEGNWNQPNRVWRNNGAGVFTDTGQLLGSHATRALALGDLDGDGDLDAVEGTDAQPNRVWRNNGTGVFTDSGQLLGNGSTFSVVLADLFGNGNLDIFEGNRFSPNRLLYNDGSGNFVDSQQSIGSGTYSAVAGDLDGDGDPDIFQGSYAGSSRVLINDDGYGAIYDSGQLLGNNSNTTAAALGDVDGDGDLDAFLGNYIKPKQVWLNNGGNFTDSGQALTMDSTRDIELGDLDGDGNLDMFEGNRVTLPNRVWRNR